MPGAGNGDRRNRAPAAAAPPGRSAERTPSPPFAAQPSCVCRLNSAEVFWRGSRTFRRCPPSQRVPPAQILRGEERGKRHRNGISGHDRRPPRCAVNEVVDARNPRPRRVAGRADDDRARADGMQGASISTTANEACVSLTKPRSDVRGIIDRRWEVRLGEVAGHGPLLPCRDRGALRHVAQTQLGTAPEATVARGAGLSRTQVGDPHVGGLLHSRVVMVTSSFAECHW